MNLTLNMMATDDLDWALANTVQAVKENHFRGVLVAIPLTDPLRTAMRREDLVVLGSTEHLREFAKTWTGWPGGKWQGVLQKDLALKDCEWAMTCNGLGYQTALGLRFPLIGMRCVEFLLLSPTAALGSASVNAAVVEMIRLWPEWRQAIRSSLGMLTPKERQSLRLAARGYSAAMAAVKLGCMPRTYYAHIDNAKGKLNAGNLSEALYLAHLRCEI